MGKPPLVLEPADQQLTPSAESRLADYARTGDRRIRNQVVDDHHWLAISIVRRLRQGSVPFEDLVQVAMLGILKAAERFDPSFGVAFKSYAAVTARGEVRRHFRDSGWAVHVPRRLQDLRYEVRAATDVLTDRLHRSPTAAEVAEYLFVDVDLVIDALCADSNYRSRSLDERIGDNRTIGEVVGSEDPSFDLCDASDAFDTMVDRLPERFAQILRMRYLEGRKQREIAAELGISQVHVSRLLEQAHRRLRLVLEAAEDREPVATTA